MKKLSAWCEKFWQWVNKDVVFEDEVSQFYVLMRIYYIITGIYILLFDCVMWYTGLWRKVPILIIWLPLHILSIFTTYRYRRRAVFHIFSAGLLTWVCLSVHYLGWSFGAQYFLFPLLVLSFFATYQNKRGKMLYTLLIGLVQMGLYVYARGREPVIVFSPPVEYGLQGLFLATLFICFFLVCYTFSNTSQASLHKLSAYSERLKQEAETDLLTGLVNRRSMYQFLEDAIHNSHEVTFTIAMGDIDFFKTINDTKGHNFGDEVLRQIAAYFKEYMEGKGLVCRWGGEEFLFLFQGMNGDEACGHVDHIRRYLDNYVVTYKEESASVTMTFGIEEYDFSSNITEMVKKADDKLYLGKNSGRNQVIY